jgi:hypothetical protein
VNQRWLAPGALILIVALSGCASALKTPPPMESIADLPPDATVDQIVGVLRARVRAVDNTKDSAKREQLAIEAVQLGQRCTLADAESARCSYWLAIALGVQARERPTTANDGLERMVALLEEAIQRDPTLDHGGPHRVLALVLLRAPGWPAGPGDPEQGLTHARAAHELAPNYPANLLALCEAQLENNDKLAARSTLSQVPAAIELQLPDDPERPRWERELATLQDQIDR